MYNINFSSIYFQNILACMSHNVNHEVRKYSISKRIRETIELSCPLLQYKKQIALAVCSLRYRFSLVERAIRLILRTTIQNHHVEYIRLVLIPLNNLNRLYPVGYIRFRYQFLNKYVEVVCLILLAQGLFQASLRI